MGHSLSALSTFTLSGEGAPRRYPASAVITQVECAAPILVQASIATGSSGTMGM